MYVSRLRSGRSRMFLEGKKTQVAYPGYIYCMYKTVSIFYFLFEFLFLFFYFIYFRSTVPSIVLLIFFSFIYLIF